MKGTLEYDYSRLIAVDTCLVLVSFVVQFVAFYALWDNTVSTQHHQPQKLEQRQQHSPWLYFERALILIMGAWILRKKCGMMYDGFVKNDNSLESTGATTTISQQEEHLQHDDDCDWCFDEDDCGKSTGTPERALSLEESFSSLSSSSSRSSARSLTRRIRGSLVSGMSIVINSQKKSTEKTTSTTSTDTTTITTIVPTPKTSPNSTRWRRRSGLFTRR